MVDTVASLTRELQDLTTRFTTEYNALAARFAALVPIVPQPSDKRRMPMFIKRQVFNLAQLYISDGKAAGKARDTWLQALLKWVFETNPWVNCINVFFNWEELLPTGTQVPTSTPPFITAQENMTWILGDFDWFYHNVKKLPPNSPAETPTQKAARHRANLIALLKKLVDLKCFGIQLDDVHTKLTQAEVLDIHNLVLDNAPGLAVVGSASATFDLTGWAIDNKQYQCYTNERPLKDETDNNPATGLAGIYRGWAAKWDALATPNIGAYVDSTGMTPEWNIRETFRYFLEEGIKGGGVRNVSVYGQDGGTDFRNFPDQWDAVCDGFRQFWLTRTV